jgi:hypothetical protein
MILTGDTVQIGSAEKVYTLTVMLPECYNPHASKEYHRCGVEQWQLVGLITRRS